MKKSLKRTLGTLSAICLACGAFSAITVNADEVLTTDTPITTTEETISETTVTSEPEVITTEITIDGEKDSVVDDTVTLVEETTEPAVTTTVSETTAEPAVTTTTSITDETTEAVKSADVSTTLKATTPATKSTTLQKLDLCFVIDTTGSMGSEIEDVKDNMDKIIKAIFAKSLDSRIAIVDFRDYMERTEDEEDYPATIQLGFTNDTTKIKNAIDGLTIGFGGDNQETIYTGLALASSLDWRKDASKSIILIGDAAPLGYVSDDDLSQEEYSGLNYKDMLDLLTGGYVVEKSEETIGSTTTTTTIVKSDSSWIPVSGIVIGDDEDAIEFYKRISDDTKGYYSEILDADELSTAVLSAVDKITPTVDEKPSAGTSTAKKTETAKTEETKSETTSPKTGSKAPVGISMLALGSALVGFMTRKNKKK